MNAVSKALSNGTQYTTIAPASSTRTSVYTLRRFSWRAILGIVGPLALLGLYTYICLHYLRNPPKNNIVGVVYVNAQIMFYIWFVVSIFALDWARTALANFQATALMVPAAAPANAMVLLWHADDNWANPLWWLRALRNSFLTCIIPSRTSALTSLRPYQSLPGRLWVLLSATTFLIFVALPLSGLTMEVTTASIPTRTQALINGPQNSTFNMKGMVDLPAIIYGVWRAGGKVTPADASYFYAATSETNVSSTYFEDRITNHPEKPLITFLSPAVDDIVYGSVEGLENGVICSQVDEEDLQIIQMLDWGRYNVTSSSPEDILHFEETAVFYDKSVYSMMLATNGLWSSDSEYSGAAATNDVNMNDTSPSVHNGFLEMYLWQGTHPSFVSNDTTIQSLLLNTSQSLQKSSQVFLVERPEDSATVNVTFQVVGFGIQCRVKSVWGRADLNPSTRTYGGFNMTYVLGTGSDQDTWTPEVLAIQALGQYDITAYQFHPRSGVDSTWKAFHEAIGEQAYESCELRDDTVCQHPFGFAANEAYGYRALSPQNVTFALYRLIGQSIIGAMSSGSQGQWKGDLYLLETTRWLKPGPVPWEPVLGMLGAWTLVVVTFSTWTLFRKRWAPVLGSFEFFRFGAQYEDDINLLTGHRFETCPDLVKIPGMVGTLPGSNAGGSDGFIGLSENVADQRGTFVYDRNVAAKHRP